MPRVSLCRYTLHVNRGNYSHEEFTAEVVEDELDYKMDGQEAMERGDALMKLARATCVRAANQKKKEKQDELQPKQNA